MSIAPLLSVVLPVHNAAPWLDACLRSIAAQDFTDFELVVLDDGSSDGTPAILADWAAREPRLRVERSAARLGAAGSSNRVMERASAPLVARMDADDLMLPGRLSAQVAFMAAHPAAVAVGGLAWTIDGSGRRVRPPDRARLLRDGPFAPFPHSSLVLRRSAWQAIGGYREEAEKWEDVDLFLRLAAHGEVWTLTRPVIEYRQNHATTRLADGLPRLERAMDSMCRAVLDLPADPRGRIALPAYRHIGATALWGGGRPRLLGRILSHGELGWSRDSLATLAWAAAATTVPGVLRAILRRHLRHANARAELRPMGEALRWQPVLPGDRQNPIAPRAAGL